MEDWDADLSLCNFATTHFPAERSSCISLQLRDHSFNSFYSAFQSPFNFATHEIEVPYATPQRRQAGSQAIKHVSYSCTRGLSSVASLANPDDECLPSVP